MAGALLGLGSGIAVNLISESLIQHLNQYKDKKAAREFRETLDNWAADFEMGREGTIAARSTFHSYVKHYRIVEQVARYVLAPDTGGLPEQLFLERSEQTMSQELEQHLGHELSPEDCQVIHDFLDSLLRQTKNFALRQTTPEDKTLIYGLCQNNAQLAQINRTIQDQFQRTSEILKDTQKMIRSLQPRPDLPDSAEDETQLPQEFHVLIQKCNSALCSAQRLVKVYSWDNLDFRSVYVLPSLEYSIEGHYSTFISEYYHRINSRIDSSNLTFLLQSYKAAYPRDYHFSNKIFHHYTKSLPEELTEDFLGKLKEEETPQERGEIINAIFRITDIVYIIGGAGYGKSLFLKNLCVNPPQCVSSPETPMLIIRGDLKRMIRPDGSFKPMLEYLLECFTNGSLQSPQELPPDFLQRCLKAGRCLILLDALDEVGNDQRNELHRLVISYFRDYAPKNKVCITSRDRGFIPEENIFCFSIRPITKKDVIEYVDRFIALGKFLEEEKERFIRQASSLVEKGFVKGFLTLSLLMAIYKNEQELPANKVALYQKCFEYIANIREKNKNLLYNSSTGKTYDWDMLAKLMENATFMELARLGTPNNQDISRDAIDRLITDLYVYRFHSETECRAAIEVFLQFCADRTEVFVPSPNSNTEYRFFHRSFYEFFYASYIAQRTKTVENTYQKLKGFSVDSELFELLVQLYNKNDPTYLRELIQYVFQQFETQLQQSPAGASEALDILVMLMQTADQNDFSKRFIQLILDRGGQIAGLHLQVNFDMIGGVFEKNQEFFLQYFEKKQEALLTRITLDLSRFLARNQALYPKLLKKNTPYDFLCWKLDPPTRFLYMRLLRILPNRLVVIDQIFEKMKTPQYMYRTLKIKGNYVTKLISFAKKVRDCPVKEQKRIYMTLICTL